MTMESPDECSTIPYWPIPMGFRKPVAHTDFPDENTDTYVVNMTPRIDNSRQANAHLGIDRLAWVELLGDARCLLGEAATPSG